MRLRSTASAHPHLTAGATTGLKPRARDTKDFAQLPVEHGFLAETDIGRIEAHGHAAGQPFQQAAIDLGLLDPETAGIILAMQGGFPLLAAGDQRVDPLVVSAFDPADAYAAKVRTIRAKMRAAAKDSDGERIAGLTVLVADRDEAVVVNVMGDLRPEMFSDTMVALDVDVTPDVQVASVAP